MALEWNEELRTGIAEIDEQQQELLTRIRGLFDACGRGKGREELARFHGYLALYVATHFPAEERSMIEHDYADLADHRAEHRRFASEVELLRSRLRKEQRGSRAVLDAVRLSVEWVARHMHTSDRDLAAYLRQRRAVFGRTKLLWKEAVPLL